MPAYQSNIVRWHPCLGTRASLPAIAYPYPQLSATIERFSKRFSSDFERSDPKHQFVKFEINSEEFLRVAHPSKHGQ